MSAVFEEMAEQNYKILISDIEEGVLRVVTFLDFVFSPRGPCPSKKSFLQKSAAICSLQGRHHCGRKPNYIIGDELLLNFRQKSLLEQLPHLGNPEG